MILFGSFIYCVDPIPDMLERIDKDASKKFKIELIESTKDVFELDQAGDLVVVRGNNYGTIAIGVFWYLKYNAGVHLSWNGMHAILPAILPKVDKKERRETNSTMRYHFNFCTFSYGTAFWDWKRWEQEIDWMAMHGINMPLALVGTERVWFNMLRELGYSKFEANAFVAGSGFQAWFQMDNLEAWGGPNPDSWYEQQDTLQKKILKRMEEFGMKPVLPGFSGMVPSNSAEKIGLNIADPGEWCAFQRPGFLLPTDERFSEIADLYYKHLTALYGKAQYYTADPFHEGYPPPDTDLPATAHQIYDAMQRASADSVWVIQSWGANPNMDMIKVLPRGSLVVLDLFSDGNAKWHSGYGDHDWIFCQINNFGGRGGMFGKIEYLITEYFSSLTHKNGGDKMKGVGATMEGYELNPVVYDEVFELAWFETITADEYVDKYIKARYGEHTPELRSVWDALLKTSYNAQGSQQGASESVMAARPELNVGRVSTWGTTEIFYDVQELVEGAKKMVSIADKYIGNNNFEYDFVNVVGQVLADYSYSLQKDVTKAFNDKNTTLFVELSNKFLQLIQDTDDVFHTRTEFMLGPWVESARRIGKTEMESNLYEYNAKAQITTWGYKRPANAGGLHDYSYRQWSGLLGDVYYVRWEAFFNKLLCELNGDNFDIDFYDKYEYPWASSHTIYPTEARGDPVAVGKEVFAKYFN